MNELDREILEAITAKPGQQARQIAGRLGLDRKLVNSVLRGGLKGKVHQDNSYGWHPKQVAGVELHEEQAPKRPTTPLAQLCRYYLDCLSHDDLGGVSEFAASKYDDPKYVEIQALPMLDDDVVDPFDTDAGRELLGRIRRDRNRQTIFLGYPVRLNLIRSRKGWEGFMAEPVLLFAFQEADTKYSNPTLTDELPQINFRALRALSYAGNTGIMEEAIQLAEELGLGNIAGEQPDVDELVARLRQIRPDWDWQEEIEPYALSSGIPLSRITQQGIYNRGILIAAERSPYTKGLESELRLLQSIEEPKYRETALGTWLNSPTISSPPADQQPLLEVLPLNSEQRQAVRQALSNPLTVITGPPGTGKSQVVMSILVNAARQGKKVLFASKNNKAVDVVETRVNALGSWPVLLRLGANQFQQRLTEYLTSLLAATATPDDHERYRECEAVHAQIQQRSDMLDAELNAVVKLRNEVDLEEQHVEHIREELGEEVFGRLRGIDRQVLTRAIRTFLAAVDQANRGKQHLFTRLAWRFFCKSRYERLADAGRSFEEIAERIGLPVPEGRPDSPNTVDEWIQYGTRVEKRLSQALATLLYFEKLAALTEAQSLEEISRQRNELTADLSENSESLWRSWLRLQPSRLGAEQRKLLGDYSALLQMMVSANDQKHRLGREVFQRYNSLYPRITSILPCWAVTSLSARGRLPFEPSFFDVLVIDEASQCDIASVLPLLFRARHAVVIGDPLQLKHISTLSKQQDQQLLSKHGLLEGHLGWAYSVQSFFDLATTLCRSEDIVALRDHHRSHADIIGFSNEAFYDGRLRIATNYDRLLRPRLDEPAVRWVDVHGKTIRPGGGGAVNDVEARAVVKEIERLLNQGYFGSIGVVSPFRAQANRIRDLVNAREDISNRIADTDFLVDTVHKFQGDERDVMIFSPVVSPGISDAALGFLRSNPNLFNVAITRARAALIVVGDKEAALNSNVSYLESFVAYSEQVGKGDGPDATPAATDLGPEYPAVSNPDSVSDWEHLFYRALYRNGIRALPQYSVEKYVLDFALVDGERRLAIEIDGERYHRNWDGELCRRDQIRNQRLLELGWDVMRFWVYQVRDDLDRCVGRVREWVEKGGDEIRLQ